MNNNKSFSSLPSSSFFIIDDIPYSCGRNDSFQLATLDTSSRYSPTPIALPDKVDIVIPGYQHTLFLLVNGKVYFSGGGPYIANKFIKIPQHIPFQNTVLLVAAGFSHSAIIDSQGDLYTWGTNAYGELGLGNEVQQSTPQKVLIKNTKPKQIACGANFTIIIATSSSPPTSSVWSVGTNTLGQLGVGINDQKISSFMKLTDLDEKGIFQIACGRDHVIALGIDSVYSWGCNNDGQLGLNHLNGRNVPSKVSISNIVVGVSAGWCHSLALTSDNRVYGWGLNSSSQLGTGDQPLKKLPQSIPFFDDNSVLIDKIGCGNCHSFAITTNGELYVWGYNGYGQLGLGDNTTKSIPTKMENKKNNIFLPHTRFTERNPTIVVTTEETPKKELLLKEEQSSKKEEIRKSSELVVIKETWSSYLKQQVCKDKQQNSDFALVDLEQKKHDVIGVVLAGRCPKLFSSEKLNLGYSSSIVDKFITWIYGEQWTDDSSVIDLELWFNLDQLAIEYDIIELQKSIYFHLEKIDMTKHTINFARFTSILAKLTTQSMNSIPKPRGKSVDIAMFIISNNPSALLIIALLNLASSYFKSICDDDQLRDSFYEYSSDIERTFERIIIQTDIIDIELVNSTFPTLNLKSTQSSFDLSHSHKVLKGKGNVFIWSSNKKDSIQYPISIAKLLLPTWEKQLVLSNLCNIELNIGIDAIDYLSNFVVTGPKLFKQRPLTPTIAAEIIQNIKSLFEDSKLPPKVIQLLKEACEQTQSDFSILFNRSVNEKTGEITNDSLFQQGLSQLRKEPSLMRTLKYKSLPQSIKDLITLENNIYILELLKQQSKVPTVDIDDCSNYFL